MKIDLINPSWWLNHPSEEYAEVKLDHFPKYAGVKMQKTIFETTTYRMPFEAPGCPVETRHSPNGE